MAVIKIKGSFDGHQNIRPVVLANEQCLTCDGMSVRLSGWGYNEQRVLPEELHEIRQNILNYDDCYEAWRGDITERYEPSTLTI